MTDKILELKDLLFKGTAVIIDDEIMEKGTEIFKIAQKFEQEGVLCVKITDVRDDVSSFSDVSFIILDWKLNKNEDLPVGVQLGSELIDSSNVEKFIKKIIKQFYIPIIIMSTQNVDYINTQLKKDPTVEHALQSGRIIVYNKGEILCSNIKKQLIHWLSTSHSAYIFKHLNKLIKNTEHRFFNEFDSCDPNWPDFVYKTISSDNPTDLDGEYQEFLLNSFSSRLQVEKINIRLKKKCSLPKSEIVKIYSSIKFLEYIDNKPQGAYCGDIYQKINVDGSVSNKFLINITACCDLRNNNFLFIWGKEKKTNNFKKKDKVFLHTVFQIKGFDSIEFDFNTYARNQCTDINNITITINGKEGYYSRIGRLLHPYITNLQDHFAKYLIRRGITKTPNYSKQN